MWIHTRTVIYLAVLVIVEAFQGAVCVGVAVGVVQQIPLDAREN